MSETYRVVTQGLKEGFSRDSVVQSLVILFKRTTAEVQSILDAKGVIVKKGLDLPTARKYQAALERRGCLSEVESDTPVTPGHSYSSSKLPEGALPDSHTQAGVTSQFVQKRVQARPALSVAPPDRATPQVDLRAPTAIAADTDKRVAPPLRLELQDWQQVSTTTHAQLSVAEVAALRPRRCFNASLAFTCHVPGSWQEQENSKSIRIVDPVTRTTIEVHGSERPGLSIGLWVGMRQPMISEEMPFLSLIGRPYPVTGDSWGTRIQGVAAEYKGVFPGDTEESRYLVCWLRTDTFLLSFSITAKSGIFESNRPLYQWLIRSIDIGNAAPVVAPARRGDKIKEAKNKEDVTRTGQVASGQRLVLYAVLAEYIIVTTTNAKHFHTFFIQFLGLFVAAMFVLGLSRLARGLRLSLLSNLLLLIACFIPVANLIMLVMLNVRANKRLRQANFEVGWFGSGAAIPASNDFRNMGIGALLLALPIHAMTHHFDRSPQAVAQSKSGTDSGQTVASVDTDRLKLAEKDYYTGKTNASRLALSSMARAGDATAMEHLGRLYMMHMSKDKDNFIDSDPVTIDQDHRRAMHWFRKAAALGNTAAQDDLGAIYEMGLGQAQDYDQAVTWYRQAAMYNDCEGQVALAWLYGSGYGVPKDFTTAYMLLDLAQRRYLASKACSAKDSWLQLNGQLGVYPFTPNAVQNDAGDLSNKRMNHSGSDAALDLSSLSQLMAPEEVARAKARAAQWKPGEAF